MEIRMRSGVSRRAKGYSVEATLDITVPNTDDVLTQTAEIIIENLSGLQIAELKEHMKSLGDAFPKETSD